MEGICVIINLKEVAHFGVWEVGLLNSFQREVSQRNGILRLCNLNPSLNGCFQNDRFTEQFESTRISKARCNKRGVDDWN